MTYFVITSERFLASGLSREWQVRLQSTREHRVRVTSFASASSVLACCPERDDIDIDVGNMSMTVESAL